jgi:hypothetical protein
VVCCARRPVWDAAAGPRDVVLLGARERGCALRGGPGVGLGATQEWATRGKGGGWVSLFSFY